MDDIKLIRNFMEVAPEAPTPEYYTSWDCLMPVINQIIKTIGVKSIDECTEEEWFRSTKITRMYIGTPIESAFKYVTEYIRWYNKSHK
jgi:hypothetical protein